MAQTGMNQIGKILTANLLLTGDVVFWTGSDWSVRADEADLAVDDAAAAQLALIEAREVAANIVISTEIIPAERTGFGVWPTRNRERVRAKGPTTHANMGPQARFDFAKFEGA